MKGFTKDGKFRPTERKSQTLSSDDMKKFDKVQNTHQANQNRVAVKLRNKESMPNPTITKNIYSKNVDLEVVNDEIESFSLGNLTDAGWFWSLSGQDAKDNANTFLLRLANSQGEDVKFIKEAEENGISFEIFKKQIRENLAKPFTEDGGEDGIYVLSGGNSTWEFGEESTSVWDNIEDSFFDGSVDYTEEEQKLVLEEAYMIDTGYDFKEYLETYGEYDKRELLDKINSANSFEEYFDQFDDDYWHFDAREHIGEGESNHAFGVISEATDNLIKAGKIRKEAGNQVH